MSKLAPGPLGRTEILLVGGERIVVDVDAALARVVKAMSRR